LLIDSSDVFQPPARLLKIPSEAKIKEAHSSKETIYQMAALVVDMYKKISSN
jgi:hypothetical protein